jgi:hypothetical protein
MATWMDVDRVRQANPEWGSPEIATELDCDPAYVRATFYRRGWKLPRARTYDGVTLRVPLAPIVPLCRDGETPQNCLRRLVHRMLVRAASAHSGR